MAIRRRLNKKADIQISFSWLFALIAGAVILFLAIYISTKLIMNQTYVMSTETAKQIEILTNPLETGFESETARVMTLQTDTKIYNECYDGGNFGEQGIKLTQKNFGKWPEPGAEIKFKNKYIFSDSEVQGKNFYLMSKQFNYPFKIADLIILTSAEKEYCLIDAPEEIEDDKNVFPDNVKFESEGCSKESIKVCFAGGKCSINVNYAFNYLEKEGKRLEFTKDLLYGAIFSDGIIYNCQIKRIMKRASILSDLYSNKIEIVSRKDCNSNLKENLIQFKNFADVDEKTNINFQILDEIKEDIENKNKNADCRLW
ncbi:MAG: hypothetical protein AABX30_00900 [Nanoarchaeota archaeon]